MKKQSAKILTILFISILFLITGCSNKHRPQKENTLTESSARQIALDKAGLETATFTKQEYDSHDNEYEFEFYSEDKEYECDINAIDGSIKSFSVENRKM